MNKTKGGLEVHLQTGAGAGVPQEDRALALKLNAELQQIPLPPIG